MYTYDRNVDTHHNGAQMDICYSKEFCSLVMAYLHFVTYQHPENFFACGKLTFPLNNEELSFFLDGAMSCNFVWPEMFRPPTIQCVVATQHSVVTKARDLHPRPQKSASATVRPYFSNVIQHFPSRIFPPAFGQLL